MSEATKLRWGILGAARINERMLPAIAEAPNAELIAIASRREGAALETLQRYAPNLNHVNTALTPEQILSHEEIDAVYIPLANHEHAEWTLKAIAHKKHVLCEKPLALTATDIKAITQAAQAQQVTVMEGFMYRFHPQYARVQALLASGVIGEVRSVRASYSFMMRPQRLYRLADSVTRGGGATWDIGCYAVHSARGCFTQPALSVTALSHTVESGADDVSYAIIDFGNGCFAQIDYSFARARRCEYEIIGTQGGITCHTVWQLPGDIPVISWWTEEGRQCVEKLPYSNHFRLQIEQFSAAVLARQAPLLSLTDALDNCRVLEALLKAAATGSSVPIQYD